MPATPFNSGPCQRGTHCEGTIIGESFWDLLKRDLPCHGKGWEAPLPIGSGPVAGGRCKTVAGNANPTMDENSALVLVTRLFYLSAGGVVLGYQCDQAPNTGAPRNGGCNADSWYMGVLAADDDDGSLANGTPHMLAIEAAFRRHGIACRVPAPMNFGCVGTPAPAAKPVVTASAGVRSATLTWDPGRRRRRVLDPAHRGRARLQLRQDARRPGGGERAADLHPDRSARRVHLFLQRGAGGRRRARGRRCRRLRRPDERLRRGHPAARRERRRPACRRGTPPPTAVDDALSVPRNHPNTINVVGNDTDPNFDVLVVASVTAPSHGQLVINPDSTLTYTPVPGYEGPDGFDYVVSDGRGGSDTGHVGLTVAGDPCAEGFTVLTDAAGDATTTLPEHDVRSASIAQSADGKFTFILKMTSLANPTPDTTWPITYSGSDGAVRFVKMATEPDRRRRASRTARRQRVRRSAARPTPRATTTPTAPSAWWCRAARSATRSPARR